jgi:hypothetical protein
VLVMRIIVAVLAALFVASAYPQSDPPAPSSGDGVQHPNTVANESKRETCCQKSGTSETPLVVRTIAGPKTQEASEQEKRERDEKSPSDWWVVISTTWISIVTTFLAVYTFRLWQSTNDLANGAERTARMQLRAYLHVGRPKLSHVSIVGQPQARFILNNTGVTPARNVRVWCKAKLVDWPYSGGYEFETTNEMEGSNSVLAPNAFAKIGDTAGFLSHSDVAELKTKKKRILVNGKVTYTDMFGKDRWTTFRIWSWGVSDSDEGKCDWRWAEAGNDCDQN